MAPLTTRASEGGHLRQTVRVLPQLRSRLRPRFLVRKRARNTCAAFLAVTLWFPGFASCQKGSESRTAVILYGGLSVGTGLSSVPRQPLCVFVTVPGGYQCEQSGGTIVNDTLTITRKVGVGTAVGIGFITFPRSHVGLRADLLYVHQTLEDHCAPISAFQPDSQAKNEQVCNDFTAKNAETNVVGLAGSVVLRTAPGGALVPYVRLGGGFGVRWGEVLAVAGNFLDNGTPLERYIVRDSSSESVIGFVTASLGVNSGSGGTGFRFELSDLFVPIQRATGPATPSGEAPHGMVFRHSFSVTIGVDIILDSQSGHRY